MENATPFLFEIAILIFSVVIHEVSHGYAALMLGDDTAEREGRLTLNPVKHLDPFGSIILPAILAFSGLPIIGWAKPVPYNPHHLHNKKWGPAIVGVAGPAANILLALVFGLAIRFLPAVSGAPPAAFLMNFAGVAATVALLNLTLALFNLVPIPPLDGSKVLFAALPYRGSGIQHFLEQYGFFILLIFIFSFSSFLSPVILFFFRLITGSFP